MGRYDYYGFGPYVSKAEKIAKAQKSREKLAKKGIVLEPVLVEGRTIARTWWRQSWVQNLERYADYSNRLSRGRSYLRNGSILDLKIAQNAVTALVSGTRPTPYKIDIRIESLSRSLESELMKKSRESLDSMQALIAGEFPPDLKEQFFKQNSGLFPSPKEIKLDCSSPDWASMCKHVAAALYGVAVRLDEQPELFFTLRGIDINSFVASVAKEESKKLLKKASVKSSRALTLDESDEAMGELFGISFDSTENGDNGSESDSETKTTTESAKGSRKKGVKKAAKKLPSKKRASVKEPGAKKLTKKAAERSAVKPVKKVIVKKRAELVIKTVKKRHL